MQKSIFAPGKAIRGDVRWFGSRSDGEPGPAHGYARTAQWTMNASRLRDDGRIEIDRALTDSAATREYIDSALELRFRVTIGSDLEMELGTTNGSNEPFTFEQALHTYLAVGGIQDASVYGLDGS